VRVYAKKTQKARELVDGVVSIIQTGC